MDTTIGQRLKSIRTVKGLNQTKLGNLVGVSQTTIGAWERGENTPTPENLVALAKALDVEPAIFTESSGLYISNKKVQSEATPGRPAMGPRGPRNSADMHPSTNIRSQYAAQFEKDVAEFLSNCAYEAEWYPTERAPNGVQWRPDLQTKNAVVEFKMVDSRSMMSLHTYIAATLWRLLTLKTHRADSRTYALIVFPGPNSDGTPPSLDTEPATQQGWPTSMHVRLQRLREEAALVGISVFTANTPKEAVETLFELDNPGWDMDHHEEIDE